MRREGRKEGGRAFARASCFYRAGRGPSNKAEPSAPRRPTSVKRGAALPAAGRRDPSIQRRRIPFPRREALLSPAFRVWAGNYHTGATSRCEELAVIEK